MIYHSPSVMDYYFNPFLLHIQVAYDAGHPPKLLEMCMCGVITTTKLFL